MGGKHPDPTVLEHAPNIGNVLLRKFWDTLQCFIANLAKAVAFVRALQQCDSTLKLVTAYLYI